LPTSFNLQGIFQRNGHGEDRCKFSTQGANNRFIPRFQMPVLERDATIISKIAGGVSMFDEAMPEIRAFRKTLGRTIAPPYEGILQSDPCTVTGAFRTDDAVADWRM
jgi:hypothetical protein